MDGPSVAVISALQCVVARNNILFCVVPQRPRLGRVQDMFPCSTALPYRRRGILLMRVVCKRCGHIAGPPIRSCHCVAHRQGPLGGDVLVARGHGQSQWLPFWDESVARHSRDLLLSARSYCRSVVGAPAKNNYRWCVRVLHCVPVFPNASTVSCPHQFVPPCMPCELRDR